MNTAFGLCILLLSFKEFVMGSDCTQQPKKVSCYNQNLKEIPQDLSKSTEIMNLGSNKIRKLRDNSFTRYTNIKILYLFENSIIFIDNGAFEPLTDLEILDLSTNAFRTLPLDLFNLPSLKTLYVDSNPLIDLKKDLMRLEKPISAPLEYLNVHDCDLDDIPNLGVLPKLKHLNASNNPLDKISFDTFPLMCALESIDFTQNKIPYCECQEISELNARNYPKTVPERSHFCDHNGNQKVCPESTLEVTMQSSPEYQKCLYTVSHPPISKKTWIIIGVCLAAIIIIVLIVIYQIRKRRQKKRLNEKKKANKADHLFMYAHNNNGSTSQDVESDHNELTSLPS